MAKKTSKPVKKSVAPTNKKSAKPAAKSMASKKPMKKIAAKKPVKAPAKKAPAKPAPAKKSAMKSPPAKQTSAKKPAVLKKPAPKPVTRTKAVAKPAPKPLTKSPSKKLVKPKTPARAPAPAPTPAAAEPMVTETTLIIEVPDEVMAEIPAAAEQGAPATPTSAPTKLEEAELRSAVLAAIQKLEAAFAELSADTTFEQLGITPEERSKYYDAILADLGVTQLPQLSPQDLSTFYTIGQIIEAVWNAYQKIE